MLNHSKLYIGRYICLLISLCLYENDYFCEEMKKRLAFLFWLQSFVDARSDRSIQKEGMRTAENCLEKHSEYKQVKGKKHSANKKMRKRLNSHFCFCFVPKSKNTHLHFVDY